MARLYQVAIIGRVNVGKSTLFNRLISEPKAIVSPAAGTTRDRNYAICSWNGLDFNLIDTGGLTDEKLPMDKQINRQLKYALDEADLFLMVVDSKTGLMVEDKKVANLLKQYKKPIVLAANKADTEKITNQIAEFYQLNIGEPFPVSAGNGKGSGDLLDQIVSALRKIKKPSAKSTQPAEDKVIKIAIIGQPNVGKSSLINALLNEERLIVSDIPHTTRDSQDILINFQKKKIVFIDTAGIRRKSKRAFDPFEKQSVEQSLFSIKRADVVLFITDVTQPLSFQDKHLASELIGAGVGVIIIANKWDAVPNKDHKSDKEYTSYYRGFLPFLPWAPLLFTSANHKINLHKILPLVIKIFQEKHKTISDNVLDKLLKSIVKKHKPSRGKGTKHPYIYSLKQIATNPPLFTVKIDFKAELHESYLKFIENNLRYKFDFTGVPIKIRIIKTQNLKDKN